jgi:predicted ATPase
LPLGIELAASWVSVLSFAEIAEEIERKIDFLATSMRDVPERHRSLRAAFDQSYSIAARPALEALEAELPPGQLAAARHSAAATSLDDLVDQALDVAAPK